MKVIGDGPIPARIMIVGEAPGKEEEASGKPFVGLSGQELSRMLQEAGMIRAECYVTNVCKWRPEENKLKHFIPEAKKDVTSDCVLMFDRMVKPVVWEGYQELLKEIELVNPNIIIAFGNLSMWALTGKCSNPGEQAVPSGITSWRGSLLETTVRRKDGTPYKLIPTYHPANILREWENRYPAIHDLRRVEKESKEIGYKLPAYKFIVRPSYGQVMDILDKLYAACEKGPVDLAVDIETKRKQISCIGLAWSDLDALCIPIMSRGRREGYWLDVQELEIVWTLHKLLKHKNCRVIGQNFQYDVQYLWRNWKLLPNFCWDTMTAHHTMFLALPRSLHFQASMYCEFFRYWKDESQEEGGKFSEDENWEYNCKDVVYTWEIKKVQEQALVALNQVEQFTFQMTLWWATLAAMLKGMRINDKIRPEMGAEFQKKMDENLVFLKDVLGHPLNPRSHPQMMKLFYQDLKAPIQFSRKTKRPTLDDPALEKIAEKEPLLKPLIASIGDYRTLGVFKSTFIESELDADGRMRCTIDQNGTDTLRMASYENAFYTGMNMQNLPSDKSKSIGKAAKRVRAAGMELKLPNIRALFPPDEGKIIWEADLDRADLQIVVWETDDPMLKSALRRGVDIHLLNAFILAGKEPPPLEELIEKPEHPNYREHRARYKLLREFAKVFCHGTNYGGRPKTMAANCGITVHDAERAQRIWFGAHPSIKDWHEQVLAQISETRSVSNKFGYTMRFFGRIEDCFTEALAWIPQSSVSCIINRGWVQVLTNVKETEVLMQVHDSLVGQHDIALHSTLVPRIEENLRVLVPYDDPLIIPIGVKSSTASWGECK